MHAKVFFLFRAHWTNDSLSLANVFIYVCRRLPRKIEKPKIPSVRKETLLSAEVIVPLRRWRGYKLVCAAEYTYSVYEYRLGVVNAT